MREMAHQWISIVHNQASKIHSLQRVVLKKEDPSTHQKFVDVLYNQNDIAASSSSLGNQYLCEGKLVEFFWQRLSASLHDVFVDKLRGVAHGYRLYPSLRKASLEVYSTFKVHLLIYY